MRGQALLIALMMAVPTTSPAWADGGIVRLSEVRDGRRITVFTPPAVRAGHADISILVQAADTGTPLLDIPVQVSVFPANAPARTMSMPATVESATNKILRAASVTLSEPGRWHVRVEVQGSPPLGFDMEVAAASPRWLAMSLWIGWPLLVIGVFAIHAWLIARHRNMPRRAAILGIHTREVLAD